MSLVALLALQQSARGEVVPSGIALHLIAVTKGGRTWSPKGGPAPDRDYLKHLSFGVRDLMFVVEYDRPSGRDFGRIAMQFPGGIVWATGTDTIDFTVRDTKKGHRWYAIGTAGPAPSSAYSDLRVGYAFGHWRTADKFLVRNGKLLSHRGIATISGLSASKSPYRSEADVHFRVGIPKSLTTKAVRVIAYDGRGHLLESHGSATLTPSGGTDYFFAGPFRTLARIEVQTQPYVWTTFRNVKIKP